MTTEVLPTAFETLELATKQQPPPVTKLCLFKQPLTAVEMISRTLQYAKNPRQYLLDTLGEEQFSAQNHLFSLPNSEEEPTLDAYGTGTTKQAFEAHIAKILGKKHGLFFLTGVQAQLAALKTYSERTSRTLVAWHVSSHLESSELGAYSELYGLERVLVGTKKDVLPTVEEIRCVIEEKGERLAALVIEIPNRTLGCQTYSIGDLREISQACSEKGVALHCDGARLWEIEPWYVAVERVGFEEVCECFDSVYVSFYKGLGGLAGAMLMHDDCKFMEEAKFWQRRAGGNAFTLGVEVLDCERGFNETIGSFGRKREKMMRIVEGIRAAIKEFRIEDGQCMVGFLPERPTCSQILTVFRGVNEEELLKARDKVQEMKNVRVFERLRSKQTLDEKMASERVQKKQAEDAHPVEQGDQNNDKIHYMEWMLMSVTEKIEDEVFVEGYLTLCEELDRARKAR